jgi:diguanylate cyclase (GGDEF)-like protein/PAS domain S-box-containing protein
MSDRLEMLEATLNLMDEGVAILDEHSSILFWNKAAAALTGYPLEDVISQPCPNPLYRVDEDHRCIVDAQPRQRAVGSKISQANDELLESPTLVSMSHKLGYSVPGMLRKVALRDSAGTPRGAALLFYPVEEADALPHGDCGDDACIERSQADMEDRLDAAHHQWVTSRMPFGLLWVTVDQAQALRKTHGKEACDAMLRTVEQTLLRQSKPAEIIGRWGCNEFLLLTHERTPDLLAERARRLTGLARTADFRWWGDRVGLTVSIGASQATEGNTLQSLLEGARQAMQASQYAGGNHVTEARSTSCSRS